MNYSRGASLVVVAAHLAAAVLIVGTDAQRLFPIAAATLLPLPFIWFPDALGNYTSRAEFGVIQRATPGVMIAVGGWLVLAVVPPILIAVFR